MDQIEPGAQMRALVAVWFWVAPAMVLVIAGLDWAGWATGIYRLTRVLPSWPAMTPWTALLLATLALAILVQSGQRSRTKVRIGFGLAVAAGAVALVVLTEYATKRSFGLDHMWFPGAVRSLQSTWPGRPSPQTAATVLLLANAIALTRLEGPWARWVRMVSIVSAVIVPFVGVAAYTFQAVSLIAVTPSTGMAISTALALLLLTSATVATRLDRNPLAWLLARPDARTLARIFVVMAGLPIFIGLSRSAFLALGLRPNGALALSISVSTFAVGAAVFHLSQREQRLLIERESLSRQRADAEAHYRILADNAVDVVVHMHGTEVAWISPSAQAAFGDPPMQWIGSDFTRRVHPDDMGVVAVSAQRLAAGEPSFGRFRVGKGGGGYHWVDCRAKPYVVDDGQPDGVIAALRVIDDQVDAEQRLERLARFDALTGLANRNEAISRLECALASPRIPGSHLGVLFCDIDNFKGINDTHGHVVGDAVLATLAARVGNCVRLGDIVGRTGGDEMLVLLPGVHGLDEAAAIAAKIRRCAAEPIHHSGTTICATLSIGVTLAVPGESAATTTSRADAAMYRAKQEGRNAVVPG